MEKQIKKIEREEYISELVRKLESDKYHDVRRRVDENGNQEGSTKICFDALWKFEDAEKEVIIKVDKNQTPESKQAVRNRNAGLTTKNGLKNLLNISKPSANHITNLLHADKVSVNGEEVTYMTEEKIEGKSLKKYVEENGTLNREQFHQVFSGIIDAVNYLHSEVGMYHRDIKPENIVISEKITEDGIELDATLVDLANSCSIENIEKEDQPVGGCRAYLDPFMFKNIAKDNKEYDSISEIYSIGSSMFYALTQERLVDFDYFEEDKKLNIKVDGAKKSALDDEGYIDENEFKRFVKDKIKDSGINNLERKIIEKSVLSPLESRKKSSLFRNIFGKKYYSLVSELKENFEKISPSYRKISRLKNAGLITILGLLTAGGFTTLKNAEISKENQSLDMENKVVARENLKLELNNDLQELTIDLNNIGKEVSKSTSEMKEALHYADSFNKNLELMPYEYFLDNKAEGEIKSSGKDLVDDLYKNTGLFNEAFGKYQEVIENSDIDFRFRQSYKDVYESSERLRKEIERSSDNPNTDKIRHIIGLGVNFIENKYNFLGRYHDLDRSSKQKLGKKIEDYNREQNKN